MTVTESSCAHRTGEVIPPSYRSGSRQAATQTPEPNVYVGNCMSLSRLWRTLITLQVQSRTGLFNTVGRVGRYLRSDPFCQLYRALDSSFNVSGNEPSNPTTAAGTIARSERPRSGLAYSVIGREPEPYFANAKD